MCRCCRGLQRSCLGCGPLLFMIPVSRGGKIGQMRIVELLLLTLIPSIRGCWWRERGTFKKLCWEMMLLLRILEDIMRTRTLENTSCLLCLVMVASKTCRNGRCRLSQRIHPTKWKWMIERSSWCSCAKITCMLEIIHWKTSS